MHAGRKGCLAHLKPAWQDCSSQRRLNNSREIKRSPLLNLNDAPSSRQPKVMKIASGCIIMSLVTKSWQATGEKTNSHS